MEGNSVPRDGGPVSQTSHSMASETTATSRHTESPRRCFICLGDEDASDRPGSWVEPCPCTLEVHQKCMLSWVASCQQSEKPLYCPVCKSKIELESPWDPIVDASAILQLSFSRLSPFLFFTAMSMGMQFSMQLYGAMAMWAFSGKDALLDFMMGPDTVIDAARFRYMDFVKDRIWKTLALTNIAPALLIGRLLPKFSNKAFLPAASLYGMYHMIHKDNFVSWPPSPRLAIVAFPYIRSMYFNLWREFVMPHEVKLNRKILGLPPWEQELFADQGHQGGAHNAPQEDADMEAAREGLPLNEAGELPPMWQLVNDIVAPDDAEQLFPEVDQFLPERDLGPGPQLGVEVVNQGGEVQAHVHGHVGFVNGGGEAQARVDGEIILQVEIGGDNGGEQAPVDQEPLGAAREIEFREVEAHAQQEPPPAHAQQQEPPPAHHDNMAGDEGHGLEAPLNPPPRVGLAAVLTNVSNAVVGALILPGVSFAMGEALRLLLPRTWTQAGARQPWHGLHGTTRRPGLLQQQWGRSLVGGCLYVVLKDALRLYSKSRRVAAMGKLRVKNVDRRQRGRRGSAATGG